MGRKRTYTDEERAQRNRERRMKYYWKNKKKELAYMKEYYSKNKERIKKCNLEYYYECKEK